MSTINVQCVDQVMTITNAPVIASGGVNEDKIQFSFCSLWDGYAKVCAFWREAGQFWLALIGSDDSCVIPAEAMSQNGKIYFGVVGVNGDTKRTSEVLRYEITEGVVTEPADPTPSIYQQILAHVATADQALEDVQELSEEVEDAIAAQDQRIEEMGIDAFEDRVEVLEAANITIESDIDDLETNQGTLSSLQTTAKSNLVAAINEVKSSADSKLPKSGGTMTGAIAMGSNKITGLGTPTANADAATKKYSDIGKWHTATIIVPNFSAVQSFATNAIIANVTLDPVIDLSNFEYEFEIIFYGSKLKNGSTPGNSAFELHFCDNDNERLTEGVGTTCAKWNSSEILPAMSEDLAFPFWHKNFMNRTANLSNLLCYKDSYYSASYHEGASKSISIVNNTAFTGTINKIKLEKLNAAVGASQTFGVIVNYRAVCEK